MQLYKIAGNFNHLQELDTSHDNPVEATEAIANALEGIELEFHDKAKNIIALIKNMKAKSHALKEEAESMIKRKKVIDNKISHIFNYLLTNMQDMDLKKVEMGVHIATIRLGRELAIVDNIDDLPDKLIRINTAIVADKIAIMSAYKAGEPITGAHIERAKDTLNIK